MIARAAAALAAACAALALSPANAPAKSFTLSDANVVVRVATDGSLKVSETTSPRPRWR